jgi:hypothetical protein
MTILDIIFLFLNVVYIYLMANNMAFCHHCHLLVVKHLSSSQQFLVSPTVSQAKNNSGG